MVKLLTVLLFSAALLLGCGGGGGGGNGNVDDVPDGHIKVRVSTYIHVNNVPQLRDRAERIVLKTTDEIMAAYYACLDEIYPQLDQFYFGHELVVVGNNTGAGYSPEIKISSAGMDQNHTAYFEQRTRELLDTPGFVPASSELTWISFDTISH